MNVRTAMRLPLLTALSATLAFAHAASPQSPEDTATMPQQAEPARTTIDGEGVRLEVAFDRDAKEGFAVRYRVTNTGDAALAVFDRGDRHAVMTKRLKTGSVPQPLFKQDGADLALSHIALPLAEPSPTLPPVPLAAKVAPGAIVEGVFAFDLSLAQSPKRVRWCLGVAPFAEADFDAPEQIDSIEVWRASFAVAERQQTLCTPWFGIATGTFEGG